MAAAVTRRRVTEEDILGFLERCRGGLDDKKVGKERESKQRSGRARGGETDQALLEKLRYGHYGFLCFPYLLLLILNIISLLLVVDLLDSVIWL